MSEQENTSAIEPGASSIDERIINAANGMSESTIASVFQVLAVRRAFAHTILKADESIPIAAIAIMDKYKEEIIKILNL